MRGEILMTISKEEIVHIAKLSNLNLSEAEIEGYAKDMTEILDYANMINSVNTEEVNVTIAANENYNVFRKDEIKQNVDREALLQNAPSKDEGMFQIPKVIS